VVNNHDGTFTLNMLGTPGAQYYLVSSPNPEAPLSDWTPVAGSTNTASGQGGTWFCVVSDPSPAHFRVVALNPGP
jgi:hypothetical protein